MSPGGHGPWARRTPGDAERRALAEASTEPFWLTTPERPPARPPLAESVDCDLTIVGGGLSGLWAALLAVERDPGREVVLLERERIANAASGRNGGFLSSFLTHGVANGMARFPDEMPVLERLGLENFAAIRETLDRLEIDCDYEATGELDAAVQPHEVEWLAEEADAQRALGHEVEVLDREAARAEVHSPIYEGALWRRSGSALVHPAKLAWGLAREAERAGVRIYEGSAVKWVRSGGAGVLLATDAGAVRTRQVLLATSAFPGLLGEIRRRIVPVWDYVLVTEPLGPERRAAIGWANRQGIGDMSNQFHYYRLTPDDRILWGGYDAIYGYGNSLDRGREQRERTFADLAAHFFTAFPQLEGIRFSNRWGGAIDTCSRFFAFQGTAMDGRVAYTVGHTGLGVGASRFGAGMALDLLAGRDTEASRLRAMRSKPLPFPPEPLRWAAIELTRNRLAAADHNGGKRGLWLRTLDRLGLGYDS